MVNGDRKHVGCLLEVCSEVVTLRTFSMADFACLLLVKVLALLMLESAAANNGIKEGVNPFSAEEGDKDSMGLSDTDRIRLLEVALRTARLCIGTYGIQNLTESLRMACFV